MNKIKYISIIFILFLIISCEADKTPKQAKTGSTTAQSDSDADSTDNETKEIKQELILPQDTAAITDIAVMKTSMGTIVLGLYGKDAPKTVKNFIGLSKRGYYDGILIHRIAQSFLIQTGDRLTIYRNRQQDWGSGGESIYGGEFEDELNPETPSYRAGYIDGTVAMANRGPNTNTSQFFICLEDAYELQNHWTIFGRVLQGLNIVEKIASVKIEPSPRGDDDGLPKKPIRLYSIKVKKNKYFIE